MVVAELFGVAEEAQDALRVSRRQHRHGRSKDTTNVVSTPGTGPATLFLLANEKGEPCR